ncbi:MAG TPA: MFS transporter [Longimicrobiaceae bacterium]|jgi:multidrug resistance protein|nr:MFS transporter [Longimicrobiaceae bacterium]
MVTAFVDMVGLLMVIPLIPFYAMKFGAGGTVVGVLVSSYALAQLLSAPMWGRMSDRYGRRPALLVGLAASAIAYVIFSFATSIWILLLSRLVQGAGGGTTGVIQAYVADATAPRDRAKALGWLSAATNMGVAIGPLLGSHSLAWGEKTPGFLAAGLCVVNMAFAAVYLRESRVVHAPQAGAAKPAGSRTLIGHVLTRPAEPAPRMIWIYAIAMGAFSGFTAILALFLSQRFGVTAKTVGWAYTWNACIGVLVRAFFLGKLIDRWGEARISRVGQVLLTAGLVLMPFTWRFTGNVPLPFAVHMAPMHLGGGHLSYPAFSAGATLVPLKFLVLAVVIALIPLGTAFTFPAVTATLSRVISERERGVYMGVQQSFGGAARVLGPVWAGWSFEHWGSQYPFWTGAALVFATLWLGIGMERFTRDEVEEAAPAPG